MPTVLLLDSIFTLSLVCCLSLDLDHVDAVQVRLLSLSENDVTGLFDKSFISRSLEESAEGGAELVEVLAHWSALSFLSSFSLSLSLTHFHPSFFYLILVMFFVSIYPNPFPPFIFVCRCWESMEITQNIMNMAAESIDSKMYTKYSPFFDLVARLIAIDDSIANARFVLFPCWLF